MAQSELLKFLGACLSPQAIVSWICAQHMIMNQLNDIGIIALVLLANDRYQAIADPIGSMAVEKRPRCRLAVGYMLVAAATGIRLAAEVFSQYRIFNEVDTFVATGVSDATRAAYLFICLLM